MMSFRNSVALLLASTASFVSGNSNGCQSVADLVCSEPSLNTLCDLVLSIDGLAQQLNRISGITVFAPTDTAFGKLSSTDLNRIVMDAGLLEDVLLYHVSPGYATYDDLTCGKQTLMLNGEYSFTRCRNNDVYQTGSGNENDVSMLPEFARVDIEACNDSIVHIIDGVLLPRFDRSSDSDSGSDSDSDSSSSDSGSGSSSSDSDSDSGSYEAANIERISGDYYGDNYWSESGSGSSDSGSSDSESGSDSSDEGVYSIESGSIEFGSHDSGSAEWVSHDSYDSGSHNSYDSGSWDSNDNDKGCQGSIADLVCVRFSSTHSTLCDFLKEADLADVLDDPDGSFTLFAPNNGAFDRLSGDVVNALKRDDGLLKDVLVYHVVEGQAYFNRLDCGDDLTMLSGEFSTTKCNGNQAFQVGNGNTDGNLPRIYEWDIKACNGVLHLVDQVLLPESEHPGSSDDHHHSGDMVGLNYCSFGFDYECYEYGKPSCCLDNTLCPWKQPQCDYKYPVNGYPGYPNYCNAQLNYDCYEYGRPLCCFNGNNVQCPTNKRPECEYRKPIEPIINYCSFGLDYDCYEFGKPRCCLVDGQKCPLQQPQCDYKYPNSGYPGLPNYCAAQPNYDCYEYGRPECCYNNRLQCPSNGKPQCDQRQHPIQNDYCNHGLDYGCYEYGKPLCCLTSGQKCSYQKPQCDYKYPANGYPGNPNFCVAQPNNSCYQYGRPECCYNNHHRCTANSRPQCDYIDGDVYYDHYYENDWYYYDGPNYCSLGLNFDCYEYGRPLCCFDDYHQCPNQQPRCDRNANTNVDLYYGPNYCSAKLDFSCYEYGRPECCWNDSVHCPANAKPACDHHQSNGVVHHGITNQHKNYPDYCYHGLNYGCYEYGRPRCCFSNNNIQCSHQQPQCDYKGNYHHDNHVVWTNGNKNLNYVDGHVVTSRNHGTYYNDGHSHKKN